MTVSGSNPPRPSATPPKDGITLPFPSSGGVPAGRGGLKIGLDARWIFRETSGIGTYTRELVRELARLDRTNEYVLFFNDAAVRDETIEFAGLRDAPNFAARILPFGIFSPWGQIRMPAILRSLKLDVFHSPNYMIPLAAFPRGRAGRTRCIVTIHDLIPLLFPEFTPKAMKTRLLPIFRRLMEEVGARANLILTVSNWSRQDVTREMAVPKERVLAIPNGVAAEYKPAEPNPRKGKTILYVGRFDPYKNVAGLLDIFARVRQAGHPDIRLRIVGSPDPRYPEPQRKAAALGLNDWIDWTGYCDGGDLVKAYQQADVFVLPSRYEGFGLTVVEAMACGTPVVCSDRSSLPEVAGDAALLCDPDDAEGFAAAIARVLDDKALAIDLGRKGIERATRYTWARTAELTLNAYTGVR